MNDNKLKLRPLHLEALKLADVAPDMEQIRNRNMTALFIEELKQRIKKGNLVNIQIRGEQTTGKSLVAFAIIRFLNKLIGKKIQQWMICPEQNSFIDLVTDTKVENVAVSIDEWNELGTTGYNATTIQAQLKAFNDIQAQRFIHRVWCSPDTLADSTSTIRLDIIDKDLENCSTMAFISYRMNSSGLAYEQLLGYVEISVKDAMEDPIWKFYKERKFMKMELLNDKGIVDNRDKNEAELIVKLVESLSPFALELGYLQRDWVRAEIKCIQEKYVAISIYGEDKITGTVYSILNLLKQIYNVNIKIENLKKVLKKISSVNVKEREHYKKQLKKWKQAKSMFAKGFEKQVHYHRDILETLQKFAEIGTLKK